MGPFLCIPGSSGKKKKLKLPAAESPQAIELNRNASPRVMAASSFSSSLENNVGSPCSISPARMLIDVGSERRVTATTKQRTPSVVDTRSVSYQVTTQVVKKKVGDDRQGEGASSALEKQLRDCKDQVAKLRTKLYDERCKYAELDARSNTELTELRTQLSLQERTIEELARERDALNDAFQSHQPQHYGGGEGEPNQINLDEATRCERYIKHLTSVIDCVLQGKNPAGRDLFYTAGELDGRDDGDSVRRCLDIKTSAAASVAPNSTNRSPDGGGGDGRSAITSTTTQTRKPRSGGSSLLKKIESLHDKLLLWLGVSSTATARMAPRTNYHHY